MRRALNFLGVKTGRFAVVSIVLITLFLSFICGSVIVKAGNDRASSNERLYYTSIVINEGDTLWNIASEHVDYSHYSSVYEYMNEIIDLNNLESDQIYAGKRILITYYAE